MYVYRILVPKYIEEIGEIWVFQILPTQGGKCDILCQFLCIVHKIYTLKLCFGGRKEKNNNLHFLKRKENKQYCTKS